MRRGLQAVYATLLALLALLSSHLILAHPAAAASGLRVKDGRLVEANGQDLVLRGVNHSYSWYINQTSGVFAAIKAAGANSARLTLSAGHRFRPATTAADVSSAVSLCRQYRLICILEAHDASGYGQLQDAATLDEVVEYWISIRGALAGQENYVIVNVANEPFGHLTSTWTPDTMRAIRRLRAAGLRHTLMVDAPDWGQDDWRPWPSRPGWRSDDTTPALEAENAAIPHRLLRRPPLPPRRERQNSAAFWSSVVPVVLAGRPRRWTTNAWNFCGPACWT